MAIGRPVDVAAEIPEATRRRRWLAAVGEFCRQRPLGAIGAIVVVVNIVVGVSANVIAPYDPLATDYGAMLARPSAAHWLAHGHARGLRVRAPGRDDRRRDRRRQRVLRR